MILIEAVNLSKTFEGKGRKSQSVLQTVNLRVNSGERVAIVGPSGSGKSTLLHCLCGFESPTDGVVRLLGEDPQKRSRSWLARQYRESVGFVFQQFNLVSSLSAYENVVLPLRLGRRKFSKASVLSTLEQLGIRDQADSLPSQMSGGEQQRTAVARALTVSPKIVFADEPTGSLDSMNGQQVMDALEGVVVTGAALVYVTHDAALAARADRVLVMRDGRVVRQLGPSTGEEVAAELSAPDHVR